MLTVLGNNYFCDRFESDDINYFYNSVIKLDDYEYINRNSSTQYDQGDEYVSIEQLIEEAKRGKLFILVDDQTRENEGDLVIPAEMCTTESINFMSKYGRGLICLSISKECADKLHLRLMPKQNASAQYTAFTVSIDAKSGISTGISAADRAHTVKTAISPDNDYRDIISPGHIFPLLSREGGVLSRPGHTEASVDISRLAGLNPSAVICEIMNDDGTMARRCDLLAYAKHYDIKMGTIVDLIKYRLKHESLINLCYTSDLYTSSGGYFKLYYYNSHITDDEYLVLTKGNVSDGIPVPAKVHKFSIVSDVLECFNQKRADSLSKAINLYDHLDRGVLIISHSRKRDSFLYQINEDANEPKEDGYQDYMKDIAIKAQILLDLGIQTLINVSGKQSSINGLGEFGIHVVDG